MSKETKFHFISFEKKNILVENHKTDASTVSDLCHENQEIKTSDDSFCCHTKNPVPYYTLIDYSKSQPPITTQLTELPNYTMLKGFFSWSFKENFWNLT